jgi:YD repeat-containing protein
MIRTSLPRSLANCVLVGSLLAKLVPNPEGSEAKTFYDLAGNVTGTQDKNGNLTACLFDALGRQTVTVHTF